MTSKCRMVVFDWDGTILDSAAAIVEAIQAASRDLGLPEPDDYRARHVIGLGLGDALKHAVPELPESRYDEMVARYRFHYLSRDHELKLFDGITELIKELSETGVLLTLATGKSRVGLDRAFKVSGLQRYFVGSRCADECFSKPHPQMLLELMEQFGLTASNLLMVGDTTHDLDMAANAAVEAIGVTYGAHTVDVLKSRNPHCVVDSVAELRNRLLAVC